MKLKNGQYTRVLRLRASCVWSLRGVPLVLQHTPELSLRQPRRMLTQTTTLSGHLEMRGLRLLESQNILIFRPLKMSQLSNSDSPGAVL